MFDISRITEAVGGLIGQASQESDTDGLMQHLSDAGVDLPQLDGMDSQEITQFLENSGIDLGNFDISQISEAAGQFAENSDVQSIGNFLSNLTERK